MRLRILSQMDGRFRWINTALPDLMSSIEGRDYIHKAPQGSGHGLGVEGAGMVKDMENEMADLR